jgi:transposase
MDSTIIEKSPNSTFEKAAWIKIRKVSYYGFKLFIIIDITTKTLVYVRFTTVDQTDAKELIPAVQKLHSLGFRLTHLGFDRGFWSGENFKFLDRRQICFFTVLKNYQKEHKDLIHKVTSRTAGRQCIKPGVWITEIEAISINTYFKTKKVRCIVVRQKGGQPWAIITNDLDLSPAQIVEVYDHRNLVEKVIEEIKNDYTIQKLPRKKLAENTCYVLLTLWSYNLLNDYNLTVLQEKKLCFQQLKSLRPILFTFTAIAMYSRFAIYLQFEITHPLQNKLFNFNKL